MPRRSVPDVFSMRVGARIRQLRQECGMSLGALADASAISKGHLSTIEHGLAAITVNTIARIADGLNVPPLYILTFPTKDERAHVAELVRSMPLVEVKRLRRQVQALVVAKSK